MTKVGLFKTIIVAALVVTVSMSGEARSSLKNVVRANPFVVLRR